MTANAKAWLTVCLVTIIHWTPDPSAAELKGRNKRALIWFEIVAKSNTFSLEKPKNPTWLFLCWFRLKGKKIYTCSTPSSPPIHFWTHWCLFLVSDGMVWQRLPFKKEKRLRNHYWEIYVSCFAWKGNSPDCSMPCDECLPVNYKFIKGQIWSSVSFALSDITHYYISTIIFLYLYPPTFM